MTTQEENVGIKAFPSKIDPNSCNFVVDRQIRSGGPLVYINPAAAVGSNLPETLFKHDGINRIMITGNVVTIFKAQSTAWQDILKPVGQTIREIVQSGEEIVVGLPLESARAAGDADIATRVQDVIDREVNPGVAGHGGTIQFDKVVDGFAYVSMGGACQGCASSTVTLKTSVETALRKNIPEIKGVIDITNHGAGSNPFYKTLPESEK
ncbi:NifU family protein [Myxococcota bacterium]|nr:NifU family protein [Myxococcota bacterium]